MDKDAETAVRQAFQIPPPHNVQTVLPAAIRCLNDLACGPERIQAAIHEMTLNGKLDAPSEPWAQWKLLP